MDVNRHKATKKEVMHYLEHLKLYNRSTKLFDPNTQCDIDPDGIIQAGICHMGIDPTDFEISDGGWSWPGVSPLSETWHLNPMTLDKAVGLLKWGHTIVNHFTDEKIFPKNVIESGFKALLIDPDMLEIHKPMTLNNEFYIEF